MYTVTVRYERVRYGMVQYGMIFNVYCTVHYGTINFCSYNDYDMMCQHMLMGHLDSLDSLDVRKARNGVRAHQPHAIIRNC